ALPPVRGGLQLLGHRLRRDDHRGAGRGAGEHRAAAVLRARQARALPMSRGTLTALSSPRRRGPMDSRRRGNDMKLAFNQPSWVDTIAAWRLALLWILPLAYAVWTAFHAPEFSTRFS